MSISCLVSHITQFFSKNFANIFNVSFFSTIPQRTTHVRRSFMLKHMWNEAIWPDIAWEHEKNASWNMRISRRDNRRDLWSNWVRWQEERKTCEGCEWRANKRERKNKFLMSLKHFLENIEFQNNFFYLWELMVQSWGGKF